MGLAPPSPRRRLRRLARRWRRPPPAALVGTLALLRLLPRVSRTRTVLLLVVTLATALIPVAVAVATGLLVGGIPAAVAGGPGSPARLATFALLGVIGALVLLTRAVGPFQSALAGTFARDVDRYLQERVMAAVGRPAGVAHLEDPQTLDLIKNAQGVGTEGLHPGDAVRALASLLPSWLQALGSACLLLAFNPWLGLLWLAMWPVVLGFLMREFIRVGQAASGQAAAVRRSDYLRDLALAPGGAKEVRLWGMLDWLVGRFDASWDEAMRPVWRARNPGRPVLWLASGVVGAVNLGAFALLAYAAIRGDLTLAALAVYTRAVQDASAFRAFDDPNTHLAYAAVAVPSLLTLERRLAAPAPARPATALADDAPREAIRFERVTFRYPRQPDPPADVLVDLDLEIPAGRSLAIVGANGAGKTTLIKLLCGLYAPTAGRVTVDGVDLGELDPLAWQARVAAIFQDFVQYHLPVRDNVGLGAPALAHDLERLRAAAGRAGALELIESLPRGWDTVLSRQYTGGTDLSGGQWQRVALARALFAVEGGARVLILDEPTAALDVRAEAALYDRFLEITRGLPRSPVGLRPMPSRAGLRPVLSTGALTTVIISHRFSTVRRADGICVLEGGRIVERGTHEQLVAAGGRYATMFALQAARFAEDDAGGGAAPGEEAER